MKRRLIASLAVAMMLVATMAMPAMAVEESLGAGVHVNEVINFTITDYGDAGLRFGGVNAGTANVSELAQNGNAAIVLVLEPDTNVSCNLTIRGTDFAESYESEEGRVALRIEHCPRRRWLPWRW